MLRVSQINKAFRELRYIAGIVTAEIIDIE